MTHLVLSFPLASSPLGPQETAHSSDLGFSQGYFSPAEEVLKGCLVKGEAACPSLSSRKICGPLCRFPYLCPGTAVQTVQAARSLQESCTPLQRGSQVLLPDHIFGPDGWSLTCTGRSDGSWQLGSLNTQGSARWDARYLTTLQIDQKLRMHALCQEQVFS